MSSGYKTPGLTNRARCLAAMAGVAVVAAILLAGASSAPAAAPPTSPLPTGFLGITPNIQPNDTDLTRIRQSGSTTVRYALSWDSIQHGHGDRLDWRKADQFMARASRAGLAVDFLVSTTPAWARSPETPGIWASPIKTATGRDGWARFIRAAVNRYGHGGAFWAAHSTLAYRPVAWTIWNEPNLSRFWSGGPNALEFAQLMNFTGPVIRAEDPKAEIVAGGVFCEWGWDIFLDHFYRVVNKASFDDLALHPYHDSPYGVYDLIKQTRQIMDAAGDHDAGIWVDEISWGTDQSKQRFTTSIPGQAENIRILFQMLAYGRERLKVEKLLWYGIRDTPGAQDCLFCGSSGLWFVNATPKPSWFVFKGFGNGAAGSIRGRVYGKKKKKKDPLAGQSLYLDLNDNNKAARGEPRRKTRHNGKFSFPSLYPTSYKVRLLPKRTQLCDKPASCSRKAEVQAGQATSVKKFVVGKKHLRTKITKTKIKSDKAKFKFKGGGGDSPYKFKCKLDRKHWKKCKSPKTYKHLKPGKHKLKVQAKDSDGVRDKSPATEKFKIKRKHHPR
jgi:hypothetical protein